MKKCPVQHTGAGGAADSHFSAFATFDIDNPYPAYERLRASEPIYWDAVLKTWVLTRQDDVAAVLADKKFEPVRVDKRIGVFGQRTGKDYSFLERALRSILFFKSGLDHRHDRRLLARVYGRISLAELETIVEGFADSLIEELAATDAFDAINDYARILPCRVMSKLVGLPDPEGFLVMSYMNDFMRTLDISSPSYYAAMDRQSKALQQHLAPLIADAAKNRRDSPLALIYEETPLEGEAKLLEAAALIAFAFVVGAETTMALIGSCVLTLLRQPEVYEQGRQDPSLATRIVAEVTRLESPVQRTIRVAGVDRMIGGRQIRAGDPVVLLLGAANRDPAIFVDPGAVRLDRNPRENVAFGGGLHTCLGIGIARIEARIALEKFLTLPRVVRADEKDHWQPTRTLRRLTSLPVRFEKSGKTEAG
jgi:cytochrome P450